jgi:predicted permease
VERELDEEMAYHLEFETKKNLRAGMTPEEARRQAAIAFGGMERYKEQVREARLLGWVSSMALDFKLGLRMLIKYPLLTGVGGLGITVAIAIGAASAATISVLDTPLPFDQGERVVAIENWDTDINNQERRILHDFLAWRDELQSVQEIGAFETLGRNLVAPGGPSTMVIAGQMSASGFELTGVPPLLGRPLIEDDEREGAPDVVVIGYDVWIRSFASDPNVVGRQVKMGGTERTVVGVMPEGFKFPLFHDVWVPLRANPSAYEQRDGPSLQVFGRLAPGVTIEEAQAELTTVGLRMAQASPETHERLRPRVIPYTAQLFDDGEDSIAYLLQVFALLLLLIVSVNVAVLVYARTAARQGEIALRTALGASRSRIIGQLFAEALVLSTIAAALGLGIAEIGLQQVEWALEILGLSIPFWIHLGLSTGTLLYGLALAAFGAVIVGAVPAIRATGGSLRAGVQRLSLGGAGMQLGKTWTILIVAQVAFAVAALPTAFYFGLDFVRYGMMDPGLEADDYLVTRIEMDRTIPPTAEAAQYELEFAAQYQDRVAELVRRLEAEPDVSSVTFALDLPSEEPSLGTVIEEPNSEAGAAGRQTLFSQVDLGFFNSFDVPILAGRGFTSGDLVDGSNAVIVSRSFVESFVGAGNPIGRQIRYVFGYRSGGVMTLPGDAELDHSYEIVGVVNDFPARAMEPRKTQARVYHPMGDGQVYPTNIILRMRGTAPAMFAGQLRDITMSIDPALRLNEVRPLGDVLRQMQRSMRIGALSVVLLTLSVLLLSAAGLYALMSFTITQRRREIGIRTALGARPGRVLAGVFSRALRQLAIGIVIGVAVAALLTGVLMEREGVVFVPIVAALMLIVGLAAVLGPARQGLRIQPMAALRAE